MSQNKTLRKNPSVMVFKRISCAANNYAWGVPGSKSTVAQLAQEAVKDFVLDEGAPYAELWMSTHPKGNFILENPIQKIF